jgi:hypothetical protein
MHDEHGNKVNIPGTTSGDDQQLEQREREEREREERERDQRERDNNPPQDQAPPAWPDSDTSGV